MLFTALRLPTRGLDGSTLLYFAFRSSNIFENFRRSSNHQNGRDRLTHGLLPR